MSVRSITSAVTIPIVVYNGKRRWTAPLDVSELVAPAPPVLARLRPSNRYVLLDMVKVDVGGVPLDNAVGLHIALEKATLEEAQPVLPRLSEALAGTGAPGVAGGVRRVAEAVVGGGVQRSGGPERQVAQGTGPDGGRGRGGGYGIVGG